MRKPFFLVAILSVLALFSASAQDFESLINQDPDRFGGIAYGYHPSPSADTKAPAGYAPVYISHYGRHGSRRQIGEGGVAAYLILDSARKAGVLTPAGESLLEDVKALSLCHEGMDGDLTLKGGLEHQGVARRMYRRFKPVFTGKGKVVHCASSPLRRCIVSMSNFSNALKGEAPALAFDFVAGQKYIDMMAHRYYKWQEYAVREDFLKDSLLQATVDPEMFMPVFFKDSPEVSAVVNDQWFFLKHLYNIVSIAQCLSVETGGLDILRHFTREQIISFARYGNELYYLYFGNTLHYGDAIAWSAQTLLSDIVLRADAALSGIAQPPFAGSVIGPAPQESRTAADLRFGHDSGVMPLALLLGLDGVSRRYPVGTATDNAYYCWEAVPMCTNLQMVFYTKKGTGDPLVKFLYNERELIITNQSPLADGSAPLPSPVSGPYYSWSQLRPYLLSLCTKSPER